MLIIRGPTTIILRVYRLNDGTKVTEKEMFFHRFYNLIDILNKKHTNIIISNLNFRADQAENGEIINGEETKNNNGDKLIKL